MWSVVAGCPPKRRLGRRTAGHTIRIPRVGVGDQVMPPSTSSTARSSAEPHASRSPAISAAAIAGVTAPAAINCRYAGLWVSAPASMLCR